MVNFISELYLDFFFLKRYMDLGSTVWFNDLNLPSTLAQERWYNLFFSLPKKGLISLRV